MSENRVGCAGWSIRADQKIHFGVGESHLSRYAAVFNAVEINSSFYRPHLRKTYERWRELVPAQFKFSAKLPKVLTHTGRLTVTDGLAEFLQGVSGLGEKLGPILAQLPPSLKFEPAVAKAFFIYFRELYEGQLVCEPRHATWFTAEAEYLLASLKIARVAADPPAGCSGAREPGGWNGLKYFRLHGTPKIYYSAYDAAFLSDQAKIIKDGGADAWCIFDNTALGAAVPNALELSEKLNSE